MMEERSPTSRENKDMNRPIYPLPAGPQKPGDPGWLPIIAVDIPVMYEDEGQDEVGETDLHWRCCEILRNGLAAHLADRAEPFRVFSDLNLYYHPVDHWAYVTPDTFAVVPYQPLPEQVTSYRIGVDGPPPEITMEVLSRRSAQQQDQTNKHEIYAKMGVPEYILVDVTGMYMPQLLLLKELQPEDGTWIDRQDADGGVTSRMGFRIIIDDDGMIRVVNAQTGQGYARPEEAEQEAEARRQAELAKLHEAEARRQAEERIRQLEEEIARLRQNRREGNA
jgi:hypothetical protein